MLGDICYSQGWADDGRWPFWGDVENLELEEKFFDEAELATITDFGGLLPAAEGRSAVWIDGCLAVALSAGPWSALMALRWPPREPEEEEEGAAYASAEAEEEPEGADVDAVAGSFVGAAVEEEEEDPLADLLGSPILPLLPPELSPFPPPEPPWPPQSLQDPLAPSAPWPCKPTPPPPGPG